MTIARVKLKIYSSSLEKHLLHSKESSDKRKFWFFQCFASAHLKLMEVARASAKNKHAIFIIFSPWPNSFLCCLPTTSDIHFLYTVGVSHFQDELEGMKMFCGDSHMVILTLSPKMLALKWVKNELRRVPTLHPFSKRSYTLVVDKWTHRQRICLMIRSKLWMECLNF